MLLLWLIGLNLLNLLVCNNASQDSNTATREKNSLVFDASRTKQDDTFEHNGAEQEVVNPRNIGGILIEKEAKILSLKLHNIANDDLGVRYLQNVYNRMPFETKKENLEERLTELHKKISTKFDKYLRLLKTTKLFVENIYRLNTQQQSAAAIDCCTIPFSTVFSHSDVYKAKISRQFTCDLLPEGKGERQFNPGRNLTEVFQHNIQYVPSVKWQYFMSTSGVQNEFPATAFYNKESKRKCREKVLNRRSDLYLQTLYKQRKNVVIVMDQGNSLSANQMDLSRQVALHLLSQLASEDRVSLVTVATKAVTFPKYCEAQLSVVTHDTRKELRQVIRSLPQLAEVVNHSLAFETAFKLLRNSLPNSEVPKNAVIAYISRGLLSVLTDAKEVLSTIARNNGRLKNKVLINSYTVKDGGKHVMYEETFMRDLAEQNFQKYLVKPTFTSRQPPSGKMAAITTPRDIVVHARNPFMPLHWPPEARPTVSVPRFDDVSKSLVVSITWPARLEAKVVGVVGMDIDLAELVEDVTYFRLNSSSYAFAMKGDGTVLMHPRLSKPSHSTALPILPDVVELEGKVLSKNLRHRILTEQHGKISVPSNIVAPVKTTYFWQRLVHSYDPQGDQLIVVVKRTSVDHVTTLKEDMEVAAKQVYHRLDLLPTETTCLHLHQLATMDTSTLFLSARAFLNPLHHLRHAETKRMAQGYVAYLNDRTGLINNPGFHGDVRSQVAALSSMNEQWLRQYRISGHLMRDHIVRRYVATPGGVFMVYPGTLLDKEYDPVGRDWYQRALRFPGRMTLNSPHLDAGGAGYVVTISSAVSKRAVPHPERADDVSAVMGMDIPVGYFHKLLTQQIPQCSLDYVECFIMDERGYLLSHRGLAEGSSMLMADYEEFHITKKEPVVASDILGHRHFGTKRLCNSFSEGTVQRYYQFNTSWSGVVANLVHGEHCYRYQVAPLPGINAFLGIVNKTCEMRRGFCPCSLTDRRCLNCKRMTQTECECPCECPFELEPCTGALNQSATQNPPCPRPQESVQVAKIEPRNGHKLPMCHDTLCSTRSQYNDCLGVVNCAWCRLSIASHHPLQSPYCSTQRVCFAGVVGARNPYGDGLTLVSGHRRPATVRSMPVGPVAGGIMGCFLVLAMAVYCYRHQVHRRQQEAYVTSLAAEQQRHLHEFEEVDPQDEAQSGHTNAIVMSNLGNVVNISPYRVNTNYQRPTPGGDSDHGYSTMTPQDDSEQASTLCNSELTVLRDRSKVAKAQLAADAEEKKALMSSTGSDKEAAMSSTGSDKQALMSSTGSDKQTVMSSTGSEQQTMLPPNQVLADVQVHVAAVH